MRWVITKDLESPNKSAVGKGVTWASGHDATLAEAEAWPYTFRLLDDDGIVYYIGKSTGEDFAPLDWAKPYSGCTEIQFLHGGRWETL